MIVGFVTAMLLAFAPVTAQQTPAGGQPAGTAEPTPAAESSGTSSGSVEIIQGGRDVDHRSAKFEEYRDLSPGTSGNASLDFRNNRQFASVRATAIGRQDTRLRAEAGVSGAFRVSGDYNRIPHRFAMDARTPYAGIGSGNLILSDTFRIGMGAATQPSGNLAAANNRLADQNARMEYAIAGAPTTDLGLVRQRGNVKLDVTAFNPLTFSISWGREERNGTRPIGASLGGFTNIVEIPEPISYKTDDIRFKAEYVSKHVYFSGDYYASLFTNHIQSLSWDNPFRTTDSSPAAAPSITGTGATSRFVNEGARFGRMALAPSNKFQNLSATVQLRELPLKTRISLTGGGGWMRQNEDLLPMTTNTAILNAGAGYGLVLPFDNTSKYMLPRLTAEQAVNTITFNGLLTSEPIRNLHLRVKYNVYKYINKGEEFVMPGGRVNYDSAYSGGTWYNELSSYARKNLSADLKYNLREEKTIIGVGYNNNNTFRHERESEHVREDIYRGSIDNKIGKSVTIRMSGLHANRGGDYEFYVPAEKSLLSNPAFFLGAAQPAMNPMTRKYDEANRKRDDGSLLVVFTPNDRLTLSASALGGRDKFPDSDYGRTSSMRNVFTGDADWAFSDRLHLLGFAVQEKTQYKMRSRQWAPGSTLAGGGLAHSVGNPYGWDVLPYSLNDWTGEQTERTNTFGAGFSFWIIPRKLNLDITYKETVSDGTIKYNSPLGDYNVYALGTTLAYQTNSLDTNNYIMANETNVNDMHMETYHGKLKYSLSDAFTFLVGHMYERMQLNDMQNRYVSLVPRSSAGAMQGIMLMDTQPKSYIGNYTYMKLTYKF